MKQLFLITTLLIQLAHSQQIYEERLNDCLKNYQSENKYIRQEAIQNVREIGINTEKAVLLLTKALKDDYWRIRLDAIETLKSFNIDTQEIIKIYVEMISSKEDLLIESSLAALAKIAYRKNDVFQELVNFLEHKNPRVQVYTIRHLAKTKMQNEKLTSKLAILIESENKLIRTAAAGALGALEIENKNVSKIIIEALKDKYSSIQEEGIIALSNMSRNKNIIPILIDVLENIENLYILSPAIKEAGMMTENSKELIPILLKILSRKNLSLIHSEVILSLGYLKSEDAIPYFFEALNHNTKSDRLAAIEAFGNIGSKEKEIISSLVELLKDEDDEIRKASAISLKKITGEDYLDK